MSAPNSPSDARQVRLPIRVAYGVGSIAGPGLVVFYLCAIWFVTRLRLTRERYAEISQALAERRAGDG